MNTRGFSTLELLIAFAVMTLSMTAVILVAFGNQSMAIDTELAQRGLYLAQKKLEGAGTSTIANFDSVVSDPVPVSDSTLYSTQLTVTDVSECAKRISSEVFWKSGIRSLSTMLTSIFVSPEESAKLGGTCATSEPGDDWKNPDTFVSENIGGQSNATGIATLGDRLYLTTAPSAADKDDFFTYQLDDTDPAHPSLTALGALNTDSPLAIGLNDVVVAKMSSGKTYAFAASASTTAQFRVIDVSDPAHPIERYALGLPGVDPAGSYPEAVSIYYYDGRVYIGTKETDGPEFHIFDVSSLPSAPHHLGSIELTHNINDIMVHGDYAYLATSDNNHELMVMDISDPAHLIHPDISGLGFDASGNDDGTAVYATNDRVYLGRARTSSGTGDDLYILDGDKVRDGGDTTDGVLGKKDMNLHNNAHTAGIAVRGDLAFLSLDDPTVGLIIYNISDPNHIDLPAACSAFNYSENSVGLTMDGRYVFSANSSNAEIRIIHDLDASCPL